MADTAVVSYIEKEIEKGFPIGRIKKAMLKAGYSKKAIAEAVKQIRAEPEKTRKISVIHPDHKKIIIPIISAVVLFVVISFFMIKINDIQPKPPEMPAVPETPPKPALPKEEQIKVEDCIKKLEENSENWDGSFKDIDVNQEAQQGISTGYDILRKVCEGRIYFKLTNIKSFDDDSINLTIDMLCDGAVDFKKLGKNYENSVRKEAKEDNLIDEAKIILLRGKETCSLEEFDY